MLEIYFNSLLIILVLVTLMWILSIILTNVSIVDLFWGTGFIITNTYYFISIGEPNLIKYILLILVLLWGLRLTIYLSWRNIGKGEDFRYQKFRKDYGKNRYWWISFFQTFLLQGLLIWIVSLPLLGVNFYSNNNEPNLLMYVAILIWIIGFMFEAGGDYQLARFKMNPDNKGKVLDYGFWKYTRHPNYFGDSAVWWAYALLAVSVGAYWYIIGSILMTLIIIKVSGVALLEKTLNVKDGYSEYVRKTSAFLPWFPKK